MVDPVKPKVQTVDGGDRLVIGAGGTLEVEEGATVTGVASESSAAWSDITGKPATFPPTIGTTATTAMAGNTTIPAAPAAGTAALLEAGTDTTLRTWSAKMIADYVKAQVTAASGS